MKTIFCSVHGYTHWENELMQIINTEEFQRLKYIKQLAAVHHVYPCGTHTRFEHSLGVGHLAEQFCTKLLHHQKGLSIDPFVLKLAGLCHDLGHGPLSHGFDAFLESKQERLYQHEHRSVIILQKIIRDYHIPIDETLVEQACELIYPTKKDLPMYMYQILSNDLDGVDMDKLDYLIRDSYFTGLEYRIDTERFFEYVRVIDDRLCYCFNHMQYTINNIFMIRHQLHALVYQHKVVRAIEFMYNDFMFVMADSLKINNDITSFLNLTDGIFTQNFVVLQYVTKRISFEQFQEASLILKRIHTRELYKCVHEIKCTSKYDLRENTPSFIVDVVSIGYEINPLYNVSFYDENSNIKKLDKKSASQVFPKHAKDFIYRIYAKKPDQMQNYRINDKSTRRGKLS